MWIQNKKNIKDYYLKHLIIVIGFHELNKINMLKICFGILIIITLL